jgi:Transposase
LFGGGPLLGRLDPVGESSKPIPLPGRACPIFLKQSKAMRRKKNKATKKVHFESLPLIHPNAAEIDVGSKEHLVAVPLDRDPQPVRTFQAFTPDLYELAAWLKRCGIETVALESTGIYWLSLYEVLEQYGFEVRVVNARHVKNVPGRARAMCSMASGFESCTASAC